MNAKISSQKYDEKYIFYKVWIHFLKVLLLKNSKGAALQWKILRHYLIQEIKVNITNNEMSDVS